MISLLHKLFEHKVSSHILHIHRAVSSVKRIAVKIAAYIHRNSKRIAAECAKSAVAAAYIITPAVASAVAVSAETAHSAHSAEIVIKDHNIPSFYEYKILIIILYNISGLISIYPYVFYTLLIESIGGAIQEQLIYSRTFSNIRSFIFSGTV